MFKTDVLIVGGGVAGLSTAYFLGKSSPSTSSGQSRLKVIVLEQEKNLGGHASGRNAGMLRQALPDPVLALLAKESRGYFEALSGNGWKDLTLQRRGSLLLAKNTDLGELRTIARCLKRAGVKNRWLTKTEAARKVSALADGDFSHALFCPSDAMLELRPLLSGFLKSLRAMGISVLRGKALEDVRAVEGGFLVKAGGQVFFAAKLVNAAGAWASWVAERSGASRVPLLPYRRHLFVSNARPLNRERTKKWPFVWDVSNDFYFRPAGSGLLLSPCDKTLEKKGDRREKTRPGMKNILQLKLKNFSPALGRLSIGSGRSGLRTMTPDGRFVVGEDARRKGFYWVAGLGGHGVTTCFSVGRLAADILLGKKVDNRMKKALSPGRFGRKRYVA